MGEKSEITLRARKTAVGEIRKLKSKNRDSKTMEKCRKLKSKFAEYLEMEMGGGLISKEEDLRLERKLAKKLKVKNGKLGGNDELAMLLEGIPSVLDSVDGEEALSKSLWDFPSHNKQKQSKHALEEIESQKESANIDGLSNSMDADNEEHDNRVELSISKGPKKKKRKTTPEEYLEMEEMQEGVLSATKPLKSQRKLKKRLKVKEGKLCRDDNDINEVFEEIPSVLDSLDNAKNQDIKHHVGSSLCKEREKMMSAEQEQVSSGVPEPVKNAHGTDVALEKVQAGVPDLHGKAKYVAPHLRSRMQNESEENGQIRKRVRGLLNRLSESNVESITREICTIFQAYLHIKGFCVHLSW